MNVSSKIIYTITDEAPALATYSFLPIVRAYTAAAGVCVETRDISLSGRILANFSDYLAPEQVISDDLAELGALAKSAEANIIKLPNISASVPQLKAAILELQQQGYPLPDYPENPQGDNELQIKARYDKIKGSAVNPVLREGNSDRRCAPAVKKYAQTHPHRMGAWSQDSKSVVSSMSEGDFFANEQSITIAADTTARIELLSEDGRRQTLKADLQLEVGDVLDGTFMSQRALRSFIAEQIEQTKQNGTLFSLHMKATMMKVSDPIIFGQVVEVFFQSVFEKYAAELDELGVDVRNGLGDLLSKIDSLPPAKREAILVDIESVYQQNPELAMVDSDQGITNLHVPSDVIIDASMPAAIRSSGQMWNREGQLQDTNFVIPDRCYAGVYEATVQFCKDEGSFDPATMGTVPNVGLMAQKAEEYGSHDKTFQIPYKGTVRIVDAAGTTLLEHSVDAGDIWRACIVKDAPIRDWVQLAAKRARATAAPAIFWLNEARAHDRQLIAKVETYLKEIDVTGLELQILSPVEATRLTLQRAKAGQDTISVTGNVLRDYLTDLFPILELGTSAKMLSIVPLMQGGGLFETGAGGSAPKHVQQLQKENHLRWDSLGEFLALGVSLEHLAGVFENEKAAVLASSLDTATTQFLNENKSPLRRVGELDNRGSHFYLALYWAQALAAQDSDPELKSKFQDLAVFLSEREAEIIEQLNAVQGTSVDLGGYYRFNDSLAESVMRPSQLFNSALKQLDEPALI